MVEFPVTPSHEAAAGGRPSRSGDGELGEGDSGASDEAPEGLRRQATKQGQSDDASVNSEVSGLQQQETTGEVIAQLSGQDGEERIVCAAAEDEPKQRKADDLLKRVAEDCKILAAYLARQKDTKDAQKILDRSEIFSIPGRILEGVYSDRDQATVHKILGELTEAAVPATADSIRGSNYARVLGLSQREVSRRRAWHLYFISAIGAIAFFITLVVGLYVSITETIVQDSARLAREYVLLLTGQTAGTRLDGIVTLGNSAEARSSRQSGGQGGTSDAVPLLSQVSTSEEMGGDQAQQEEADSPPPVLDAGIDDISEFLLLRAREETEREYASGVKMLIITTGGILGNVSEERVLGAASASVLNRSIENVQRYINSVLASYVLPLCASVLGATVFIVRDRGRRLENISLSSRQGATYLPRLMVAAIAGIVIGWFASQDTSGVLGKLSPAAGSFVVGYSIEIMFNILDSIKQALGVKEAPAGG